MWTLVWSGSSMRESSLSDSLNYYLSCINVYFNNIYYLSKGDKLVGSQGERRDRKSGVSVDLEKTLI